MRILVTLCSQKVLYVHADTRLVLAVTLSFLSGAAFVGWAPKTTAPSFELEQVCERTTSEQEQPITVRPSYHPPDAPELCSVQQTEDGPKLAAMIYTTSASGSLRIERLHGVEYPQSTLLVVAPHLPSCYALAWADRLSGSDGWLFRFLLRLWGAQSFRLAAAEPIAPSTDPACGGVGEASG